MEALDDKGWSLELIRSWLMPLEGEKENVWCA